MAKPVTEAVAQIPTEVLAAHIIEISHGLTKLLSGPLNERALVLLINDASPTVDGRPVGARAIRAVLRGISDLERTFVRKAS